MSGYPRPGAELWSHFTGLRPSAETRLILWHGHGLVCFTFLSLSEFVFELNGRLIADRGMQSAGIVDVVDEGADLVLGVLAAAITLSVDLLGFERMHEALGLGVVLRRSRAAHAGVGADLAQAQGVVAAGVLHAAVGMMDQVLQRTATRGDGLVERLKRQAGLQMIGERPAHDFSWGGVHDQRQIDELLR